MNKITEKKSNKQDTYYDDLAELVNALSSLHLCRSATIFAPKNLIPIIENELIVTLMWDVDMGETLFRFCGDWQIQNDMNYDYSFSIYYDGTAAIDIPDGSRLTKYYFDEIGVDINSLHKKMSIQKCYDILFALGEIKKSFRKINEK